MGDFRKKSCRLISREKKSCKEIHEEKYPALKKISLMVYTGKKSYTIIFLGKISGYRGLGEKIFTQTKSPIPPPPLKSRMVDP